MMEMQDLKEKGIKFLSQNLCESLDYKQLSLEQQVFDICFDSKLLWPY